MELLAPAGGPEQLEYAIRFGADAVYLGCERFGMRARATNFTLDTLPDAVARAHAKGVKVHLACNVVMHQGDLVGLPEFLQAAAAAGVDALIIGALSYICLSILGIPYYPLVSVFVGILSFIPVFGILIGTILGTIIILLAAPIEALWFVIFMFCLYLVNKKMIKPKVVRTAVDASSVFMLTAIIITTGLLGFWGLVLGVPLFAVCYAFLHSLINKRLDKRGFATDPYEYYATKAGKELYIEREFKKAGKKRRHEVAEIFSPTDDDPDEENGLFSNGGESSSDSLEGEFPQ
jgi:hypothetical protein